MPGVDYLDKWKREKVLPILSSGIGRGSLFRHLFSFIFENTENWIMLEQVDKFSPLQSDVLTSTLLEFLLEHKTSQESILSLPGLIFNKLTMTPLVQEHLTYLTLTYDQRFDLKKLTPKIIIECLTKISEVESLHVTHSLAEIFSVVVASTVKS